MSNRSPPGRKNSHELGSEDMHLPLSPQIRARQLRVLEAREFFRICETLKLSA